MVYDNNVERILVDFKDVLTKNDFYCDCISDENLKIVNSKSQSQFFFTSSKK